MSQPVVVPSEVARINPQTGRFDDSLMPPSVAANATIAYNAAVTATQAAADAVAAAANAAGGPDAAASASAAASAQLAAQQAQAAAEDARDLAETAAAAAAGGGASQASIDQAIANLGQVARDNNYKSLDNKPTIPATAADLGALPAALKGAANGVASLDANQHHLYAEAAPGARFDYFCPPPSYDVQPLRASLTQRTDIHFCWYKATAVSTASGFAIPGDSWRRWSG